MLFAKHDCIVTSGQLKGKISWKGGFPLDSHLNTATNVTEKLRSATSLFQATSQIDRSVLLAPFTAGWQAVKPGPAIEAFKRSGFIDAAPAFIDDNDIMLIAYQSPPGFLCTPESYLIEMEMPSGQRVLGLTYETLRIVRQAALATTYKFLTPPKQNTDTPCYHRVVRIQTDDNSFYYIMFDATLRQHYLVYCNDDNSCSVWASADGKNLLRYVDYLFTIKNARQYMLNFMQQEI